MTLSLSEVIRRLRKEWRDAKRDSAGGPFAGGFLLGMSRAIAIVEGHREEIIKRAPRPLPKRDGHFFKQACRKAYWCLTNGNKSGAILILKRASER